MSNKPKNVINGVNLLYTVVILGIISGIINIFFFAHSAQDTQSFGIAGQLITLCVVVAINWFIVYMISKRHNWARILYLIFFVIGVVFFFLSVPYLHNENWILIVINIITTLCSLTGLYFLFQKDASLWFDTKK